MLTIVGFGKYKECSSFWKSKTSKEPGIIVPLYRGNIQGPLKVTVRLRSKEGRGRYRFTGKLKIKPFKSHIFSLSLLWHSNLGWFLSAMWLSQVWSRSPCTFQQREWAAEGWLFAFSWLLDFCPDWLFPKEISPSLSVSDLLQGWRSVWSTGPEVGRPFRSREQYQSQVREAKGREIPGSRSQGYRVGSVQSTTPPESCWTGKVDWLKCPTHQGHHK